MKYGISKFISFLGNGIIGMSALVGIIICFQDPYDFTLFSPITLGIATLISGVITGSLFLGLSEIIDLLEDIKSNSQKSSNIIDRMDNFQRKSTNT